MQKFLTLAIESKLCYTTSTKSYITKLNKWKVSYSTTVNNGFFFSRIILDLIFAK